MIQVFGKEWFSKHKPKIIWLLNHSSYFRKDLGIQECDLPNGEKITDITPNSFSYGDRYFIKDGQLMLERTTDFRTHDKFAKRLYYGFYPIWNLAHKFDMSVANRWVPAANLGFDTLTAYPAAGTGGSTSDGRFFWASDVNLDWSTIRTELGSGNVNSTTNLSTYIEIRSNANSDKWRSLGRVISSYDTSSLTSSANISSSVASWYGAGSPYTVDNLSITPNIDVYSSSPADPGSLITDDFDQVGSTSYTGSPISYGSWNTSGYNDFTFNATGISGVSKTGITELSLRNANYDVSGTTPTWSDSLISSIGGYYADQTGTTNDPKLVVTYTIPSAFVPIINFI